GDVPPIRRGGGRTGGKAVRLTSVLVLSLLVTACVTVRVERGAAEPVVEPVGTAAPELDTGDLVDPEVVRIVVGDTPMVVALAADPPSRSRGLMEVEDLGDLDGMLF